jgi:hypothetical protein
VKDINGKTYESAEIDSMFEDLESNDSMNDFLWSLHETWEDKRFLSMRQLQCLIDAWEEIG